MKAIFLTGGSGFIGSHFINTIAEKYPDWCCRVLMRGNSRRKACSRLNSGLRRARMYMSSEPSVANFKETNIVLGDIQSDQCGVSPDAVATLADCGIEEFWHFASSLNFEERRREHIRSHNVSGAINAVKLAISIKCNRFIYVSTAYTAGKLQGQIPERLHDGVSFNNYYEETKNEAEKRVAALCRKHKIGLVILRPSIVIGPMKTKTTGGSTTGFYGFVREMVGVSKLVDMRSEKLRISGDPDAGLNFIPIDFLLADICHVIDAGFTDGSIYHLSVDDMPTVDQFVTAIAEALGFPGLSVQRFDRESASQFERIAAARTTFYVDYMSSRKTFLRSIPTRWSLTQDDVRHFVREYVAEFQKVQRTCEPRSSHTKPLSACLGSNQGSFAAKIGLRTVVSEIDPAALPPASADFQQAFSL